MRLQINEYICVTVDHCLSNTTSSSGLKLCHDFVLSSLRTSCSRECHGWIVKKIRSIHSSFVLLGLSLWLRRKRRKLTLCFFVYLTFPRDIFRSHTPMYQCVKSGTTRVPFGSSDAFLAISFFLEQQSFFVSSILGSLRSASQNNVSTRHFSKATRQRVKYDSIDFVKKLGTDTKLDTCISKRVFSTQHFHKAACKDWWLAGKKKPSLKKDLKQISLLLTGVRLSKMKISFVAISALSLAIANAQNNSVRRRLSFEKVAGYSPGSQVCWCSGWYLLLWWFICMQIWQILSNQVTDHCAIDLDQAALETELAKGKCRFDLDNWAASSLD